MDTDSDSTSTKAHQVLDDKFSRMPKDIVHKIMFLLLKEDLLRLSAVSKYFLRAFKSLPVLDIDYDFFLSKVRNNNKDHWARELYDFVADSVRTKREANRDAMERVAFTAATLPESRANSGDGLLVSRAIRIAVNFALKSNAKELVFEFPFKSLHGLPWTVFRARSIRTVRLSGLVLDIPWRSLALDCPLLEDFSLVLCSFRRHGMTVSLKGPRLRTTEFYRCERVRRIEIAGPAAASLESFSYSKKPNHATVCEVASISSWASLKCLELEGLDPADKPWFTDTVEVSFLPALESLKLKRCSAVKRVSALGNDQLKAVSLTGCKAVERVDIAAPVLEFFEHSLEAPASEEVPRCEINLEGCKRLRDLRLRNVADSKLKDKLSCGWSKIGFRWLENLVLEGCDSVEVTEFISDTLKRLEISKCEKLRNIAIYADSLASFMYRGRVLRSPPVFTSVNLEAELELDLAWWVSEKNFDRREALRNFVSHFGHCKKLTLTSNNAEGLYSFPRGVRDCLVSPLYDLQHLNVKFSNVVSNTVELIDGLLWLAPRPKTISITFGTRLSALLKFYYEPCDESSDDEEDESTSCCHFLVVKCWRHHLVRVEVEAFEAFIQESDLRRYFSLNNASYTFHKPDSPKSLGVCSSSRPSELRHGALILAVHFSA